MNAENVGSSIARAFDVASVERGDVGEVVRVHEAAFPRFFMTRLGPHFLREYYTVIADHDASIFLKASSRGAIIGFVAGFVRPAEFYRALRARRYRLGLAVGRAMFRRPWLVPRLMLCCRRAGSSARNKAERADCELASLAVGPHGAGQGAGTVLVGAFVERAKEFGVHRIVLTTDARENERVVRFYRRLGFVVAKEFRATPRRVMYQMVLQIKGRQCQEMG